MTASPSGGRHPHAVFVYVLRRRHATLMTDRLWTGRDYG